MMILCCKIRDTDIIWVKCQPCEKKSVIQRRAMSTQLDVAEGASVASSTGRERKGWSPEMRIKLISEQHLRLTKEEYELVQSVPGYLCNRALGEGAAQGGFRRTPAETLQWVHRESPASILVKWCQLGWDPLEPLCRDTMQWHMA